MHIQSQYLPHLDPTKEPCLFRTVVFDFDSTLVHVEGVDELARIKGVYKEVAHLTKLAMEGQISFSQALSKRLSLIQPQTKDLRRLTRIYQQSWVPGAQELIANLLAQSVQVHIITGGYYQAIAPCLSEIHVPLSHLHAIHLMPSDTHLIPKPHQLLLLPQGKLLVLKTLNPPGPIAVVGDGTTDMSMAQCAQRFIGYGGVVKRMTVEKEADHYSSDTSLQSVYNYLIS